MMKRVNNVLRRINLSLARRSSVFLITNKDNAAILKDIEFVVIKQDITFIGLNKEIGIRCKAIRRKDLKKKALEIIDFLIEMYFEGNRLIPDDLRQQFDNIKPFIDRNKITAATVYHLSKMAHDSRL